LSTGRTRTSAELADNLPLYLYGKALRDVLAMELLYRQVREVPGAIFAFGVHRGRHLRTSLMSLS
jgi:3-O-methyltransferase